jgi:hypothetical protein
MDPAGADDDDADQTTAKLWLKIIGWRKKA